MKPTDLYFDLQQAIETAKTIPPCQITDPEVWFGNEGDPLANRFKVAQKMCQTCPVIKECAAFAVANGELYGVWGGLTPNQRKEMSSRGRGRPSGRVLGQSRQGR